MKLGTHHTAATRARMRASQQDRVVSPELRERINAGVIEYNARRTVCPSCGRLVGLRQLRQHVGSARCLRARRQV